MIPTLLVVGLAVGIAVHDRVSLRRSLVIGAAVTVLWGIVIGVGDRSLSTFFGAAVLGLANIVVGAVLGAGTRNAFRLSSRGWHRSPAR
jgi:hypothetical protein